MSSTFYYGSFTYANPHVGDRVRFVVNPSPGQPGLIRKPTSPTDVNGVVHSISNGVGYCEVKKSSKLSPSSSVRSGSASGITINVPVSAGGSLKVT